MVSRVNTIGNDIRQTDIIPNQVPTPSLDPKRG